MLKTIFNDHNIALSFRQWLLLAGVFFILRGTAAIILDYLFYIEKDVDWYATLARNLLEGNGFVINPDGEPILWRGPVYPLFLAFVWWLVGDPSSQAAILVAQVLIDTCTAVLIVCIAKLHFGNKTAVLAALIFTLYPISVYYSPRFMPTSLYGFFITLVVAMLTYARSTSSLWRFALSGIFSGLAALIKASAIYLIPFLSLIWFLKYRQNWRKTTISGIIFLLGSMTVLVPWGVRSYMLTGVFSVSGTSGGYSLWLATRIESEGREEEELEGEMLEDYLAQRTEILTSARQVAGLEYHPEEAIITWDDDEAFQRAAMQQIRENLFELPKYTLHKAYRFWFEIYHLKNRWANIYIFFMQLTLLSFAVYGIIVAWRHRIDTFPIVTAIIYFTLLHSVSISTLRYSVPLLPIVTILAAIGFIAALENIKSRLTIDHPVEN